MDQHPRRTQRPKVGMAQRPKVGMAQRPKAGMDTKSQGGHKDPRWAWYKDPRRAWHQQRPKVGTVPVKESSKKEDRKGGRREREMSL